MTDAARELARGHELTLINGTTVRVIFSLYTLAVVEDELGSIDQINTALGAGTKGKLVRTVGKLLANATVDETGNPAPYDEDQILRQIALADIAKVIDLIQKGLDVAFQEAPNSTTAPVANTRNLPNLHSSHGANSSTPGVSSSANAAEIFGG